MYCVMLWWLGRLVLPASPERHCCSAFFLFFEKCIVKKPFRFQRPQNNNIMWIWIYINKQTISFILCCLQFVSNFFHPRWIWKTRCLAAPFWRLGQSLINVENVQRPKATGPSSEPLSAHVWRFGCFWRNYGFVRRGGTFFLWGVWMEMKTVWFKSGVLKGKKKVGDD